MNGIIVIALFVLLASYLVDTTLKFEERKIEHEEKMYLMSRDTMPHDSIVTIQGNKFKLKPMN